MKITADFRRAKVVGGESAWHIGFDMPRWLVDDIDNEVMRGAEFYVSGISILCGGNPDSDARLTLVLKKKGE